MFFVEKKFREYGRGQWLKYLLIASLLGAITLLPSLTSATSFHTISIDGTNDFVADETIATTTGGFTAYATWDANNLYLGYEGSDVGSSESNTKWMVWYIDTDPQACDPTSGNGTNRAAGFATQNWALPFNADYFMQVRADEGFNQLNSWDGSNWVAAAPAYSGSIFDNDGANYVELSLPLSDIGTPTSVRILGFFINEQGGGEFSYGAFPAGTFGIEGDAYKPIGVLYDWYEYDLTATGVAPNAAANTPSALNCVVDDTSTQWGFVDDNGNGGTGEYVGGPATPPVGAGSARLALTASNQGYMLATGDFPATRLADISALSYSTYRTSSAGPAQAVAFNIAYDPNVTDGAFGWFGRLVYEPYNQGSNPQTNVWETWDMIDGGNGKWWASTNASSPVDDACPQSSPCTLSTILSSFPNIGLNPGGSQILFKAGGGWASFDGNVDNFSMTINGVTYSYDMEKCSSGGLVTNTDTGETFCTIQAAIDDGDTLAGHTLTLASGTYAENVNVSKSVTLRGVSPAATKLTPASDTGSSGDARAWYLVSSGVTFNLENVTMDGTGYLVYQAIRNRGQGSINNVVFTEIKYNPSGPNYQGIGIAAFGSGPVNVSDVTFSEIGRVGILYYGASQAGATVNNMSYTGKGSGDWLDYALDVNAGAQINIDDLTVSANRGVASSDGSTSAGILVSTFSGSGTQAVLENNNISDSTTAVNIGVNTSDTSDVTVRGNDINNVDTALRSRGTNSTLTAYANNITNFTSGGLTSSAGTINARHNWWGTHSTQPAGVDNDSWNYRLGAVVSSWGLGSLGSASLTAAGGSGTGVIVSHGRGLANVPFGKGVVPFANAMCSDYYDFFVLGSGDWTVSVPTDAGTQCDATRTDEVLYQFLLSGTMPDATCTGGACWDVPTGVSLSGSNLQVTVDADAILEGTPFVAGGADPDSSDPTAVTLSTFNPTSNSMMGLLLTALVLFGSTAVLLWKRQTR